MTQKKAMSKQFIAFMLSRGSHVNDQRSMIS